MRRQTKTHWPGRKIGWSWLGPLALVALATVSRAVISRARRRANFLTRCDLANSAPAESSSETGRVEPCQPGRPM
eukprot:1468619-Pyramimonas_sp.AAC.1